MKIALFIPGGVDRSGEHRVIPAFLWLVERLARRHEVHVFAREQEPAPDDWTLLGARVHNIGAGFGRARRLMSAVNREQRVAPFDVLHGFFVWGGLWAAALGLRYRIPVMNHLSGGELASMPDIGYGERRTLRGRIETTLALRGARRVTAASGGMLALAERLGVRARLLPLGVALDRWPAREPGRRDSRVPIRLLHVGDLRPVKDQATLLAAVRELRAAGVDAELDVCGLDTIGDMLQGSPDAAALGEHVRWHGHVARDILRRMMERADVLVVTSRHEAGPLVVLEAAVVGVPTVGTAVGHVADWAPDAAIAVPVGSASALAAALRRVAADEELRLSLAHSAQRRAIAIDADYTAAEVERAYMELARS